MLALSDENFWKWQMLNQYTDTFLGQKNSHLTEKN